MRGDEKLAGLFNPTHQILVQNCSNYKQRLQNFDALANKGDQQHCTTRTECNGDVFFLFLGNVFYILLTVWVNDMMQQKVRGCKQYFFIEIRQYTEKLIWTRVEYVQFSF